MEKLISVIVPVYNTEKYINECINSIRNQKYSNIEIIIVDDESTDKSLEIIKKLSEDDDRIKLIMLKHKGVSNARNVGIENARGEYISFVDSDDIISYDFLQKLYDINNINSTQIAQCNVELVDVNKKHISYAKTHAKGIVLGDDLIYELYTTNNSTQDIVLWNKLYKRDVFQNIRFPIGRICEDEFVMPHILTGRKVSIVNHALYKYRQRSNSLTHTFNKQRLDIVFANNARNKFYKKKNNEILYKVSLNESIFQTTNMLRYTSPSDKRKINFLLNWYDKFSDELEKVNIEFQRESHENLRKIIGSDYGKAVY